MGMWLGGSNFRVVIPILFVLMVSCGTAEGISNHGLAWGIEVGDRFDYHYSYRSSDPSNSEDLDYYVVVDSLPEIPVDITELPQVSSSSTNEMNEYFSFYLMNGTEITPQSIPPNPYLVWSSYPIGNWSLVEDSIISQIDTNSWNIDIINTETKWGYDLATQTGTYSDSARYSKIDGVLNFFERHVDDDFFQYTITYIRTGEISSMLIPIGVAGLSIAIIVVAIVVKKRS